MITNGITRKIDLFINFQISKLYKFDTMFFVNGIDILI